MVNLSALGSITSAANSISNLILVTPQDNIGYKPQQLGENGFLFDYEGENSILLQADITDHYVEDNSSIQDHIALKPEEVTVHGYVGELRDFIPDLPPFIKTLKDKLTQLGPFFPELTETALIVYNTAFQLAQTALVLAGNIGATINTLNTGSALTDAQQQQQADLGLVVQKSIQTQQQIMFLRFYTYMQNRIFFTVQTPWAIFNDMTIKSVKAVQDPDTRMISEFQVTFKKLRFAETIDAQLVTSTGRRKNQAQATSKKGLKNLGPSVPFQLG